MVWSDRQRNNCGTGAVTHYLPRRPSYRDSAASMEARAQHRQLSNVICVVDPYSRKLEVPRQYLHDTHALHRIGIPSLCMLYLDGRCRAGTMCHQAHVDLEIIEYLRKEAMAMPTCCQEHGDLHSSTLQQIIGERTIWFQGQKLEPSQFANTLGMQRFLNDNAGRDVELLTRNICRLHLQNKCRYVEECNHVHLCRGLKELVLPTDLSFTSLSSGEISHEASTPPETPPLLCDTPSTPQRQWVHSPYHWKVLNQYDYMSQGELEELTTCPYPAVRRF